MNENETEINWDKVEEVLDWIEQNPNNWDQGYFVQHNNHYLPGNECGTTYCMAGATLLLNGVDYDSLVGPRAVIKQAREILGIDRDSAEELFLHSVDSFSRAESDSPNPTDFRKYVYDVLKNGYRLLDDPN